MLWDGWSDVWQVLASAVLLYGALVALLRISGKRTLAHMNLFDWVVTVALGSTLATAILSPEVSVAEGAVAFAALVALQAGVALASSRSGRAERIVKAEPALLVHRGELARDAMRRERVSEREILQALRQHGLTTVEDAAAVVLETNGSLSVTPAGDRAGGAATERLAR